MSVPMLEALVTIRETFRISVVVNSVIPGTGMLRCKQF